MGLTIHYSGKFNPQYNLQDMIEETIEITQTHQWKYHVFENCFPKDPEKLTQSDFDENRYGLMVIIPHAEPLHLHFNANKNLGFKRNFSSFEYDESSGKMSKKLPHDSKPSEYGAFTKTQYAGAETHIKIVNLLKYIALKYLIDVSVHDESNYWETNDENQLRRIFNSYSEAIDLLRSTLRENCKEPNESSEEYLNRKLTEENRKIRK